MGQGGKKGQLVNNDITKTAASWQQCDSTGLKEGEVKLEEVGFHVNVF